MNVTGSVFVFKDLKPVKVTKESMENDRAKVILKTLSQHMNFFLPDEKVRF